MIVSMAGEDDDSRYPADGFSSDLQCPNRESSIYANDSQYSCDKFKYNPRGTGLMFQDLQMPVMLLDDQKEVDSIVSCYRTYNYASGNDSVQEYPLCSVELKAFMHGAGNTEVCWRRNSMIRNLSPSSYCQRLGGLSSYSLLADQSAERIIVVAVRIDSFSLFDREQPGTSSPVAAMATLFALAEALRPMTENISAAGYNVMFVALAGESYDYIGSQRLLFDLDHSRFPSEDKPISMNHIDLVIELSQLIDAISDNTIYTHTDPKTSANFPQIARFISLLKSVNSSIDVVSLKDQPLPPSSSQMFIKAGQNGAPAVVIADYKTEFKTNFYNSYLDTAKAHNMNVSSYDDVSEQAVFLSRVSSLLAQAIYQFTNADSTALLKANASTVHHVMYCLLTNPQCDLFFQVLSPSNIPGLKQANRPFPFYVGVFISEKSPSNDIQRLTKHMLAYFSGSPLENVDNSSCINMGGVWMNGPLVNGSRQNVCYSNRTQYHVALSPAFDITGYNFSSGQYSTWTESVWDRKAFHIKLFLRPSLEVELACMVAGISLFIASAIFIVYIHRRADVLFPAIIPSLDSTEPL